MAKDPFKVAFGQRLRLIAEERGIATTEQIANAAGATRAAADTWLNGRALPKWEQAARLATELGVTLDWLATGKPDGPPYATFIRLAAIERGEAPAAAVAASDPPSGASAAFSAAKPAAAKARKAKV